MYLMCSAKEGFYGRFRFCKWENERTRFYTIRKKEGTGSVQLRGSCGAYSCKRAAARHIYLKAGGHYPVFSALYYSSSFTLFQYLFYHGYLAQVVVCVLYYAVDIAIINAVFLVGKWLP